MSREERREIMKTFTIESEIIEKAKADLKDMFNPNNYPPGDKKDTERSHETVHSHRNSD